MQRGVYCHPQGPRFDLFAQATSPPEYNSWFGTIVHVTDKAFTLGCFSHLSQGYSKGTSLGTNGISKALILCFFKECSLRSGTLYV